MPTCKDCNKNIEKEDELFQCPDCINVYHIKCVDERIIKTETITGRVKKTKVYLHRCPNCGRKIQK